MIEDASVQPVISASFDENWVTFTIRYVVDHKKRRSTKDTLFMQILNEIEQMGQTVRIASTATEISLVETADMNVKINSAL
jgi:hypothetical protein